MPGKNFMDHAIVSRTGFVGVHDDEHPSEYRYWVASLLSIITERWLDDELGEQEHRVIIYNMHNVLYHCGGRSTDGMGRGRVVPYPWKRGLEPWG